MHIFQKNGIFGFWFGNRTESKSDVRKCTLRIKYENIYSMALSVMGFQDQGYKIKKIFA